MIGGIGTSAGRSPCGKGGIGWEVMVPGNIVEQPVIPVVCFMFPLLPFPSSFLLICIFVHESSILVLFNLFFLSLPSLKKTGVECRFCKGVCFPMVNYPGNQA